MVSGTRPGTQRPTIDDVLRRVCCMDDLKVINWLQRLGLIADNVTCMTCGVPMALTKRARRLDGYEW